MEARASFKDVLSSPQTAPARVSSATVASQTVRSSPEVRGLSVLEMLPQGFTAIPPNNITLSVRLDDHNYLIWREQLMTVIMAHRLEGFINGSILVPTPFLDQEKQVSNPLFSVWIQYDSLVKSWIYGSVTQGMNAILLGHVSARSQWLALEERFTSSTQSRVMELRGKLQTLKKEHCPVICELLNDKGQTAVHCAAEKGKLSSVKYLLTKRELNSDVYKINQQDIDGNTPAHLAAYKAIKERKYRRLLGLLWKNSQVDGTVVNNEGLTIFDIILSSENLAILYKLFFLWWLRTSRQGVPSLKGQVEEIKANMHKNKINKTKGRKKDGTFEDNPKGRKEDGTFEDNTGETILRMALERTKTKRKLKILLKARKNKWRIIQKIVSSVLKFEIHKELTKNNMLIATLIATVSFAAAFQVPGGYESGDLNKGQPVLRNKVDFGLFFIFDCLAFGFSSCSIFLHFYASVRGSSLASSALLQHAINSTGYSILAMVAAFVSSIAMISKDYYPIKVAPYACVAALMCCLIPLLRDIKYLIFK